MLNPVFGIPLYGFLKPVTSKPIVAPAVLAALFGTVRISVDESYVHAKVPERVKVPVQVGEVK